MKIEFNKLLLSLVFLNFFLFFIGFFFNENSAGAGGYNGDLGHVLKNLKIVIENNLNDVLLSEDYYSNRTPLLYLIHKYLNPLTHNVESFRFSVFFFSFIAPILFFYCLKYNFPNEKKEFLLCISTFLLISPYYRTSSYWALEENFGITFTLLTFLFYYLYKSEKKIIYFTSFIFLGSACVYFDQKLLIIPIYFYLKIIFSNKYIIHEKKLATLFYFISALPYLYLIYKWKYIFPISHKNLHSLTSKYLFDNILYTITIISFYFFPFLILKTNIIKSVINLYRNKFFLLSIVSLIILIFLIQFYYIKPTFSYHSELEGGGVVRKLIFLFTSDLTLQNIFLYLFSFVGWNIICLFVAKNNLVIILYYLGLSVIIYPLFQETFDPILLLLILFIFGKKFTFNYKKVFYLNFYFLFFLASAIIYYQRLI